MAEDHLKKLPVDQLGAWYLRLADGWERSMPDVKNPLAAVFLRAWVNNRQTDVEIQFESPEHLRSNTALIDVLRFHREVFLTNKKARFSGGAEKWAGALPRIQGLTGFQKWNMKGDLPLEYESLCDVAPNLVAIVKVEKTGTNAERDIFGSLRGFQLKSKCIVTTSSVSGPQAKIHFTSWIASATDRYDWNYAEYLTVPNPDHNSRASNAVRPQDQYLTVYHSNAERLEKAGMAAPFKVVMKPWAVTDARVTAPAIINVQRNL